MFDVSLTLALHREGPLLRRTLLSLQQAAQHARADGITVELVATLDRADEATRQVLREFEGNGFEGCNVVEVDHGSLGLSRNTAVEVARGRYISTCDGDDLISANSIAAMFRLAESAGHGNIIFPQYIYAFGARYYCWKIFPLQIITPLCFLETHPYISRAFAHRSIFQTVPYADARLSPGYAYEDWHFNAECVARGYGMLVAEDTVLFYRQRQGSLLDQANQHSSRQILPSLLFQPDIWIRTTRDAYEQRALLSGTHPNTPNGTDWGAVLDSAQHRIFLRAANAIDPAIDPVYLRASAFISNLSGSNLAVGVAYHEICMILGAQRFDEVFLLPFIAKGGAERYVGDVMDALYNMRPTSRILVLLGEPLEGGSRVDRVPPNATVLDLGNDWPQLTLQQRQLIALKLVQAVAPRARLHLRSSLFAQAFYGNFKMILRSNPAVLYRFCDVMEWGPEGAWTKPWGFDFVSEHAQDLTLIVADNQEIIDQDRKRIGLCTGIWRYLPARQAPVVTETDAVPRAMTAKGRVLWASRLDQQKRPELLPRIAKYLGQIAPEARMDVFGSTVLEAFDVRQLTGLRNLGYCGPFDGIAALDYGAYDAFVYTSAFDGMPNVILEAISVGLPIIAPDVGGIGEIIIDGESGLLLPVLATDDEMAASYATAIGRLANDPALRARLVSGALRRLIGRHAPEAFSKAVFAIFNDGTENVSQGFITSR